MLKLKELIVLITASLVLGYLFLFPTFSWSGWLNASLLSLLLLAVNTLGYKVSARFFDSDAEIHHWTLQRYGFHPGRHFDRPLPAWAVVPLGLLFVTWGFVKWLAITTFEASPLTLRERRVFSRVSEWDLALIAVGGLFFNIALALVSRFFGFDEFVKLNLYFVIFNLIPLGKLSGNKIFFGSKYLWVLVTVFALSTLVLLDVAGVIGTIAISALTALGGVILFYYLLEA